MVDLFSHYKKHIPLILINLTPFIPLSLRRRGGSYFYKEGAEPPLKISVLYFSPPKVRGERTLERGRSTYITGVFKRRQNLHTYRGV